jgi:tetratricopeptide (TPR) repeat protein
MNPERIARLREVLLTALTLPKDERPDYLDRACGEDADLRIEADSLLHHEGRTPGFLNTGGLDEGVRSALGGMLAALRHQGGVGRIPERIGPYRVLGLLGEGGMGIVYRAEQTEPIHRELALKLVRPGMGSASMIARFEAERHALASMEHPNIARVLDAGDVDGQPYIAMELVRGVPITQYCRARSLPVRGRLELALQVCDAVRHAHRHGIVHRDLKPSNVLVTMFGGKPIAKVIDFSIAKALEKPWLGTEFRTRTGHLVGTLEYMSPEQARGETAAVDTRSDVYSLGVLLYELLAERLPIDLSDLSLPEAIQHISEEPPRLLRGASTTATGRLDADLETILRKCLEKSPDRRYASAAELVEDIERYLESRPILARPPGPVYQLRKLVARHRVVVGSAALVFVILLAFVVTVSIQLGIQSRERARAETALARAGRINAFLQDMLSSSDPANLGVETTVREALDWSSRMAEIELGDEPELLAELFQTVGDAHRSLGDYASSRAHLERALALRREQLGTEHVDVAATLESLSHTARLAGDAERARELARESLGILRSLPEGDARIASVLGALTLAERDLGNHEVAGRYATEALDRRRRELGAEHRLTGESLITLSQVLLETDYPAAYAKYGEGLRTLKSALGEGHPQVLETISNVGVHMYKHLDEREEGIHALSEVVDKMVPLYGADHLLVAVANLNRANLMLEAGADLPAAESATVEALKTFRRRLGRDHGYLGMALNNLGFIRHALNNPLGAEEAYREALDNSQEITVPESEFVFLNFGILLTQQGRFEEAATLIEEGTHRRMLYRPGRIGFPLWARSLLLLERGDYRDAEEVLRQTHAFSVELGRPSDPGARIARNMLGRCLVRQGRFEEGERLLAEQRAFLLETTFNPPYLRHELLRTAQLYERSKNDDLAGEYREAILRLDQAIRRPCDPSGSP